MSVTMDFVGRIDPGSRTMCRVDCQECDLVVTDEDPAYVYFDVSTATYMVLCAACHAVGEN